MAISAIGQALGAAGVNGIAATKPTAKPSGDFGKTVVDALQNLDNTQKNADNLALKAASGDLSDVHNYMIAATEANVQTEFTVAVRNKAVEAFNEIMRMQV
ncbi:MAG: fliE [Actinomycetia bacterium]|jgi:flagellar hook-basal body complex protein FliE|nr:fliE [Actinomycetes bacterium]